MFYLFVNDEKKVFNNCSVYNVEKYINECLSSLINQTYKNIEIVVINDGSSDNSLSLIEEYSRIDDRIRVIDQKIWA